MDNRPRCPVCHSDNIDKIDCVDVCRDCGHDLKSMPASAISGVTAYASGPRKGAVVRSRPVLPPGTTMKICRMCGEGNPLGAASCWACDENFPE